MAYAHDGSKSGFTLVELCVMITIVGIAAAMVVMNGGVGSMSADAAAQAIAADLRYAQSLAITHQQTITFTCDTANRSYTLSDASGPLTHPITRRDYIVELSDEEGFSSVSLMTDFPGEQVSFTLSGAPTPSSGGYVMVYGPSSFQHVQVHAVTGKVTVEEF
jgi:Tfp pilus assembly protein FimT